MSRLASSLVGSSLRRMCIRLARLFGPREEPMAVDMSDPLGGALRDTDLLLAFAAQSYRKIADEKVRRLTDAQYAIASVRAAGGQVSAKDKADFWIAYDDLTADMAPLSAHSIRASIQVNALRLPESLLTPTAYNAGFAVLVFMLCLALQGFWVAGKELVDRADAIEAQKSEVQQKLLRQVGLLERAESKSRLLARQRCLSEPECANALEKPLPLRPVTLDASSMAALNSQLLLTDSDLEEKHALTREYKEELARMNENSRPLESLLRKWHTRASTVCSYFLLRFFCPVDISELDLAPITARREELARLRGQRQPDAVKVHIVESELAALELDRFRGIVVQVRLIVANVGNYLIAMVMGVLGALAFILRSLSTQLREHTYVPVSVSISIVRICLGAIAGVFGSLLAPGEQTLKSLPPLFIPFAFGYGIEILFSLLDKIVRAFTQSHASAPPAGRS